MYVICSSIKEHALSLRESYVNAPLVQWGEKMQVQSLPFLVSHMQSLPAHKEFTFIEQKRTI